MNNNTAGKEITAPVILTDDEYQAQRLQKRFDQQRLYEETLLCKGKTKGLEIAAEIVRQQLGIMSPVHDAIFSKRSEAHQEWAAANRAWMESL